MAAGRLTPLQARLLCLLAGADPGWTLAGGAALAAAYTRHRETRDLDLFWRGRETLGDVVHRITDHLQEAGLASNIVQRTARFARIQVEDAGDIVLLDLIAEPSEPIEEAVAFAIGGVRIPVVTRHELLIDKLCALLERSELRDLVDVEQLLAAGGDLERAVRDAPRKDGGFSLLTLAWTVRTLDVPRLAAAAGWETARAGEVAHFRDLLVARLMALADPRR
ncbi:MAG: nucleotidyl transferase AbiEii/AbiGii toxin family protein [Candidatus Eisenbacteria bacterium]|nr:nucleotidyl transferase AbiEii/AbiGii toxin family protein [Candidatus Eisenbacteria bacterium]